MTEPYRVLARRYRPRTFAEVVGQPFAVRALSRAMSTGRISHAYLLTGIRGVGKTSIARIIAKSLCCDHGPTPAPCGGCRHCLAITADAHPDVTEVDAASKTGVDDVREIVESTRYMPVDARYLVYIIDEVHMLSRGAFNALLKTLEEPPPEVVFVLATTDPQKLPATIVSRCQRYELRRVDHKALVGHYRQVALAEGYAIDDAAIAAIARASEGSVRDGLSMLDQAFSLEGEVVITEAMVLDMLGMANRGRVLDMLGDALLGDAMEALETFDDLHAKGADPLMLTQAMLDWVYQITKYGYTKMPDADERVEILHNEVDEPKLVRAWQMLLKGCIEVQEAPRQDQALEMLLVRLATVADLPTPAEVIRMLEKSRG